MKKNLIFLSVIILVFFIPHFIKAATLILSPSTSSTAVNGTFTVNILLNTTGQNSYGVDINRLRFNPSLLQVVDSDGATSGVQIGAGSLMSVTSTNIVDNTAGTIQFSQLANFGSTYNGSGTLGTITFRAISSGTANVTFDFTSGSGTDSNVAGLGSDLLTSVGNGTYTLNSGDTTPPIVSSITTSNITNSGVTITWTTNESSTSFVQYGLTPSYGSSISSGGTTSHSVTISGLSSNTSYSYRISATDTSGNVTLTTNQTFTTSAVVTPPPPPPPPSTTFIVGQRVQTTANINVRSTANTTGTLLGTQILNALGTILGGGASNGGFFWWNVNYDNAPDGWSVEDFLQNYIAPTPPPPPTGDTTPPVISSITTSNITTTGVTITWITNESSTSFIQYGLTPSYGSSATSGGTTSHSVTLSGLSSNTSYSYRVSATDTSGNVTFTTNQTFTTSAVVTPPPPPPTPTPTPPPTSDTTPPVFTGVAVSNITSGSATVTWTTNEPSTTYIDYGLGTAYNLITPTNTTLSISHSQTLKRLRYSSTYHLRVNGKDAGNNIGSSIDYTFVTLNKGNKPPKINSITTTEGSVNISWAEPNEYYAGVSILRSTTGFVTSYDSSKVIAVLPVGITTYSDINVTPGASYYYTLFSYDDAGVYSDPSMVSFTTRGVVTGGGGGTTPTPSTPSTPSTPTSTSPTLPLPTPLPTPSTSPLPPISTPLTRPLFVGTRDPEVTALQNFLIARGYLNLGSNTGLFGELTRTAVQKYQCDTGIVCGGVPSLTGYGLVGGRTRTAINADRSSTATSTSTPPVTPKPSTPITTLITRPLFTGIKNTEVTALQNFLIARGYLNLGSNTGYFGPLTRTAVQKYQCDKGIVCGGVPSLTGYGVVGPKTRVAINAGR